VGTECGGDDVAAGGRLGTPWRAHEKASREGSRARTGRGRRVDAIPSGGGATVAAERRPGAAYCTGDRGGRGKQSRGACARGGRREGRGSRDLFAKLKNYRDPTGKKDFPLI
jgi:hypothetical protein